MVSAEEPYAITRYVDHKNHTCNIWEPSSFSLGLMGITCCPQPSPKPTEHISIILLLCDKQVISVNLNVLVTSSLNRLSKKTGPFSFAAISPKFDWFLIIIIIIIIIIRTFVTCAVSANILNLRRRTFTFDIYYRPSVCLSVVCLQRSCTLLRRL